MKSAITGSDPDYASQKINWLRISLHAATCKSNLKSQILKFSTKI